MATEGRRSVEDISEHRFLGMHWNVISVRRAYFGDDFPELDLSSILVLFTEQLDMNVRVETHIH